MNIRNFKRYVFLPLPALTAEIASEMTTVKVAKNCILWS